jgi:hypothetical protein
VRAESAATSLVDSLQAALLPAAHKAKAAKERRLAQRFGT